MKTQQIRDENISVQQQMLDGRYYMNSISKRKIHAFNFPEYLVEWNYSKKSLSSNLRQKIFDGFRVYNIYLKFNIIKSLYYLILLSLNSIKRKF